MPKFVCQPFVRKPPKGQSPLQDPTEIEKHIAWAIHREFLKRPNLMFRKDYQATEIPYEESTTLEAVYYHKAIVGCVGAVLSVQTGLTTPNLITHYAHIPDYTCTPTILRKVVNLKQYNDTAFYHFVAEVLPRFLAWEDDGETPILLGIGPAPKYVYQYFELLGVVRDRILGIEVAAAVDVIWPTFRPWTFFEMPREPLLALRDRLRPKAPIPNPNEVILPLRDDDSKPERLSTNKEDLIDCLLTAGYYFTPVRYSRLSVSEQIRKTGKARVLIGDHGGDLTNMLWLPDNSTVIEIFSQNHPPYTCYWHLANCLGHNYYSVFTDSDGKVNLDALQLILDDVRNTTA